MRRPFMISIMLCLLLLAAHTARAAGAPGYYCDFEDRGSAESWDGGIFDDADSVSGDLSFAVNNPRGDEVNGRVTHAFSYLKPIELTGGEVYIISMRVKNLSSNSSSLRSAFRIGENENQMIFEFGGISKRWVTVSQYFMVPETDSYSFAVELEDGTPDQGFYVDDLTIEPIDLAPESLTLIGDHTLVIPYEGEADYSYSLGALSGQGDIISLFYGAWDMEAVNLPAGVSFDGSSCTVTVSDYCPNNAGFTVKCASPYFLPLGDVSVDISLTKNIFKNPDFYDGDKYWGFEPTGEIYYGNLENYLTLSAEIPDVYGYRGTLRPNSPSMLTGGTMYVLRARVRAATEAAPSVYSGNIAETDGDAVSVNFLNLPAGDWTEVIAAFTPEVSGLYDISINFYTPSPDIIDIGEVSLSPEDPEPTYVTIHAPGNISIPASSSIFPLNVYVRDQAGRVTDGECSLTLYPEGRGVSLTGGRQIYVSPNAEAGDYEIRAEFDGDPLIADELTFTLSYSNIGDGGFEERRVNEWWAAAQPATLTIEDGDSGKYAHIVSDDNFAIVLNNSYMKLYANRPYAFSAKVLEGFNCTVTAFLETTGGDRVPLIQSAAGDGEVFALFQIDEEATGRLMLYISSEDAGVNTELDDVELFQAIVNVSAPKLSGTFDVDSTVDVSFDYYNNLDSTADISDCTVSWFIMNASGDEDEYIGSGNPFVIPQSAYGRYIYCEVTAVCKRTGLSSGSMQSVPIMIGPSSGGQENPPERQEITVFKPEISDSLAFPVLNPIKPPVPSDFVFDDVDGHWAAYEIMSLYDAKVVTGADDKNFDPEGTITRGELAVWLCRAFSATGGNQAYYDVPKDSWYSGAVASVTALDIMGGVSDSYFAPDELVTREQLATVLARTYEAMDLTVKRRSITLFYDYRDISIWARDGVETALGLGILRGTSSSTLIPGESVTRGETCYMIERLLEYINNLDD